MNKQGGTVHPYNGILFGYEKEHRLIHAAVGINHKNLKLSERDQSKNDHILSDSIYVKCPS